MREAQADPRATPAEAALAACLATVLELPVEEVPEPEPGVDLPDGWRRWLAGRGVGLVPLVGAGDFSAEVVDSFAPPLAADEHRRNVVTRGIDVNALVGRSFTIGAVRCRGDRLCEPCTVLDRYSERSLLRPLVHQGGLRADILTEGTIAVGDKVEAADDPAI